MVILYVPGCGRKRIIFALVLEMSYNHFNMEDKKPIFTTASETAATCTTESYTPENKPLGPMESVFSALANSYQPTATEMPLYSQPEPKIGDIAPSTNDFNEEMLMNLRINDSNLLDEVISPGNYFNMGMGLGRRTESVASSNMWGEGSTSGSIEKNSDMVDTFDFLMKSLAAANNYVSMLTREQLSVLRAMRPSLLYEFLLEVARVRTDKRARRAGSPECAFCKNNGENEECYTTHTLKDYRGRVLCPVLRAFRCPRCSATGDRAHTIKYCPENGEGSGNFGSRRRSQASSSVLYSSLHQNGAGVPPATPSSNGSASLPHSLWNFTMN